MTRNLSIFNQLRPVTIGFDDVFDHFERMFDGDVFPAPMTNYPPYNIVRTGDNTYDIEVLHLLVLAKKTSTLSMQKTHLLLSL